MSTVFRFLMNTICFISFIACFVGGLFGFFVGCWYTFDWLFNGGIDAIMKIAQHGRHTTREDVKFTVLYLFLWCSSGIIIPAGGVIGGFIGVLPGWIGICLTEDREIDDGWMPSRLRGR